MLLRVVVCWLVLFCFLVLCVGLVCVVLFGPVVQVAELESAVTAPSCGEVVSKRARFNLSADEQRVRNKLLLAWYEVLMLDPELSELARLFVCVCVLVCLCV